MSTKLRIRSAWESSGRLVSCSRDPAGGCPDPWRGATSHHQATLLGSRGTPRRQICGGLGALREEEGVVIGDAKSSFGG